jgi:hypothetical protein
MFHPLVYMYMLTCSLSIRHVANKHTDQPSPANDLWALDLDPEDVGQDSDVAGRTLTEVLLADGLSMAVHNGKCR